MLLTTASCSRGKPPLPHAGPHRHVQLRRSLRPSTPARYDWEEDDGDGSEFGDQMLPPGGSYTPRTSRSARSGGSRSVRTTSSVYGGVKSKLMGMTLELDDKTKTVAALKAALAKMRSDRDELVRKMESDASERSVLGVLCMFRRTPLLRLVTV